MRPLGCLIRLHRGFRVVRVRHVLHAAERWGLKRPGTLEYRRCLRCKAGWTHRRYDQLRQLDELAGWR